MQDKRRFKRGSITVEACISFPIFLTLFFLFLFFIKLIGLSILLDHGAAQTAKQVAATSYPIGLLANAHEVARGELDLDLDKLFGSAEQLLPEHLKESLGSMVVPWATGGKNALWELQNDTLEKLSYSIIQKVLHSFLDEELKKGQSLRLLYAKIPYTVLMKEQDEGHGGKRQNGAALAAGKDFGQEDAVVQIAYEYAFRLPFIGERKLTLVSTAVERGWIRGSNGVVTVSQEGLEFEEPVAYTVYITRTGIRYHINGCRYLRLSKMAIEEKDAVSQGYTPCKVCKPASDSSD